MSQQDIRLLVESELRDLVPMDADALEAIERAFAQLSGGKVAMPPIQHVDVADRGDIDIKSAFIDGVPVVAVKIGAGFPANRQLGLPTSAAMMIAISAETGRCHALLLDNAYLTDLRTGLAGAVAARLLAPPGPIRLGIVGAGVQARFQAEAVAMVRRLETVTVWARRGEQALDTLKYLESRLECPVHVEDSLEALCSDNRLIVTTTLATEPLVRGDWLRPGTHVTAMGSDLPGKRELDGGVLERAGLIACDRLAQCRTHGELQWADENTVAKRTVELGELIVDRTRWTRSADDITVCDLTGTGAQDTAIAAVAVARAEEAGIGRSIEI